MTELGVSISPAPINRPAPNRTTATAAMRDFFANLCIKNGLLFNGETDTREAASTFILPTVKAEQRNSIAATIFHALNRIVAAPSDGWRIAGLLFRFAPARDKSQVGGRA